MLIGHKNYQISRIGYAQSKFIIAFPGLALRKGDDSERLGSQAEEVRSTETNVESCIIATQTADPQEARLGRPP